MKNLCLFVLLWPILCNAQTSADTVNQRNAVLGKGAAAIEKAPQFPGGTLGFSNFIAHNLKYPDVARLVGINGKVLVSFVIDKDGSITDITPKTCIGAGCESEAVNILSNSPRWMPGVQNGKAVRVQYQVPISFNIEPGKVNMNKLRNSDYGFIFFINDKIYTLDEAENILGRSFPSKRVLIAEHYADDGKYYVAGKKETYLIKIKG